MRLGIFSVRVLVDAIYGATAYLFHPSSKPASSAAVEVDELATHPFVTTLSPQEQAVLLLGYFNSAIEATLRKQTVLHDVTLDFLLCHVCLQQAASRSSLSHDQSRAAAQFNLAHMLVQEGICRPSPTSVQRLKHGKATPSDCQLCLRLLRKFFFQGRLDTLRALFPTSFHEAEDAPITADTAQGKAKEQRETSLVDAAYWNCSPVVLDEVTLTKAKQLFATWMSSPSPDLGFSDLNVDALRQSMSVLIQKGSGQASPLKGSTKLFGSQPSTLPVILGSVFSNCGGCEGGDSLESDPSKWLSAFEEALGTTPPTAWSFRPEKARDQWRSLAVRATQKGWSGKQLLSCPASVLEQQLLMSGAWYLWRIAKVLQPDRDPLLALSKEILTLPRATSPSNKHSPDVHVSLAFAAGELTVSLVPFDAKSALDLPQKMSKLRTMLESPTPVVHAFHSTIAFSAVGCLYYWLALETVKHVVHRAHMGLLLLTTLETGIPPKWAETLDFEVASLRRAVPEAQAAPAILVRDVATPPETTPLPSVWNRIDADAREGFPAFKSSSSKLVAEAAEVTSPQNALGLGVAMGLDLGHELDLRMRAMWRGIGFMNSGVNMVLGSPMVGTSSELSVAMPALEPSGPASSSLKRSSSENSVSRLKPAKTESAAAAAPTAVTSANEAAPPASMELKSAFHRKQDAAVQSVRSASLKISGTAPRHSSPEPPPLLTPDQARLRTTELVDSPLASTASSHSTSRAASSAFQDPTSTLAGPLRIRRREALDTANAGARAFAARREQVDDTRECFSEPRYRPHARADSEASSREEGFRLPRMIGSNELAVDDVTARRAGAASPTVSEASVTSLPPPSPVPADDENGHDPPRLQGAPAWAKGKVPKAKALQAKTTIPTEQKVPKKTQPEQQGPSSTSSTATGGAAVAPAPASTSLQRTTPSRSRGTPITPQKPAYSNYFRSSRPHNFQFSGGDAAVVLRPDRPKVGPVSWGSTLAPTTPASPPSQPAAALTSASGLWGEAGIPDLLDGLDDASADFHDFPDDAEAPAQRPVASPRQRSPQPLLSQAAATEPQHSRSQTVSVNTGSSRFEAPASDTGAAHGVRGAVEAAPTADSGGAAAAASVSEEHEDAEWKIAGKNGAHRPNSRTSDEASTGEQLPLSSVLEGSGATSAASSFDSSFVRNQPAGNEEAAAHDNGRAEEHEVPDLGIHGELVPSDSYAFSSEAMPGTKHFTPYLLPAPDSPALSPWDWPLHASPAHGRFQNTPSSPSLSPFIAPRSLSKTEAKNSPPCIETPPLTRAGYPAPVKTPVHLRSGQAIHAKQYPGPSPPALDELPSTLDLGLSLPLSFPKPAKPEGGEEGPALAAQDSTHETAQPSAARVHDERDELNESLAESIYSSLSRPDDPLHPLEETADATRRSGSLGSTPVFSDSPFFPAFMLSSGLPGANMWAETPPLPESENGHAPGDDWHLPELSRLKQAIPVDDPMMPSRETLSSQSYQSREDPPSTKRASSIASVPVQQVSSGGTRKVIGKLPPKWALCVYWLQRRCRSTKTQCEYAHGLDDLAEGGYVDCKHVFCRVHSHSINTDRKGRSRGRSGREPPQSCLYAHGENELRPSQLRKCTPALHSPGAHLEAQQQARALGETLHEVEGVLLPGTPLSRGRLHKSHGIVKKGVYVLESVNGIVPGVSWAVQGGGGSGADDEEKGSTLLDATDKPALPHPQGAKPKQTERNSPLVRPSSRQFITAKGDFSPPGFYPQSSVTPSHSSVPEYSPFHTGAMQRGNGTPGPPPRLTPTFRNHNFTPNVDAPVFTPSSRRAAGY